MFDDFNPYEKHCSKLTDHDDHIWYERPRLFRRDLGRREHHCKGWVALDGATRPAGNTREFEERKRG